MPGRKGLRTGPPGHARAGRRQCSGMARHLRAEMEWNARQIDPAAQCRGTRHRTLSDGARLQARVSFATIGEPRKAPPFMPLSASMFFRCLRGPRALCRGWRRWAWSQGRPRLQGGSGLPGCRRDELRAGPSGAAAGLRPTGRLGQGREARGSDARVRRGWAGLPWPSRAWATATRPMPTSISILRGAPWTASSASCRPRWGRPFPRCRNCPPPMPCSARARTPRPACPWSGRCTWAACPMRCAVAWTLPPTKPWPMRPAAATPCIRCWCSATSAPSWPSGPHGCASVRLRACACMTRPRKACSRRA